MTTSHRLEWAPPILQCAAPARFPAVTGPPLNHLWAMTNTLKTPHAYAVDFYHRPRAAATMLFASIYVGRLGTDLLTQRDLNQPLNIVDPKRGLTTNGGGGPVHLAQ